MPRSLQALTSFLCFLLLIGSAIGQEDTPKPTTTGDVKVERSALELQLTPLTKDELTIEVEGWLDILKAKVVQVVKQESIVRTADAAQKSAVLDAAQLLENQRIEIVDRLTDTIEMYRRKAGDPTKIADWQAYIASAKLGFGSGGVEAALIGIQNWTLSPQGGIRWGLNILKALAILLAFKILGGILSRITRRTLTKFKKTSDLLRDFFVNAVRKVVFFIGLIIAMSMLEVPVGPFLAAIGAAGFVIGFALQGTLSNFASGIMILLYRPYDINEVVSVAGVTGKVEAMTLVSTSVLTPDNQTVIIPNNSIWGDVITNVTGKDTRRVDMVFGIGYSDDIDEAMRVIEEIVTAHELVLKDPAPVIRCHELADSSVNFAVRPWAKTSDYWDVYWDLTKSVKQRFDKEGISIPYPQQDVYVHQVAAP